MRGSNGRKRVIITRQPIVSPSHVDNYSVDSVSLDSFDRPTSSPSKTIKIIRKTESNPVQGKIIKSIPWYKSTKGLLTAGGIFLAVCVLTILPTTLGIVLSRNPEVKVTSIASPDVRTAIWSLDGSAADANNTYIGTVTGGTYTNATYFGIGYALSLTGAGSYALISSPFFNLSYTSFTIEAWIYLTSIASDNIIFSQCCTGCQDQCIVVGVQTGKIYMGMPLNNVYGTTILLVNTWYHVAYVYDYSTFTQSVYLQGILEGTKTSVDPYTGQTGSIMFGAVNLTVGSYTGNVDAITLTTTAKTAASILSDATLVAYFSFDSLPVTQVQGPNALYTYSQNTNRVAGKRSTGLSFSGTSSYFQMLGMPLYLSPIRSHSFAMWIYPYAVNGGNLLQKSKLATLGGPCNQLIGFNSVKQIVFAAPTSNVLVGPFITANQWTHIGYTYSAANGIIMYVNGVSYGTTGSFNFVTTNSLDWLNVGWGGGTCPLSPIVAGYYQGIIDELYVYQRELTASEIATLALS